jgi:hypothetical protein
MTQEHLITPPPELVREWNQNAIGTHFPPYGYSEYIATQAARWGADQELEACCEWVRDSDGYDAALGLRADRRPKPPSLKEQALQALALLKVDASTHGLGFDSSAIRRALESLPD